VGVTFVIITAGRDLSTGALAAFSGAVTVLTIIAMCKTRRWTMESCCRQTVTIV